MPKTAVLVIDMQKDFTRPEGRFYYPETTGEMMKTFPEKLNKMRDLGALVVIVYALEHHAGECIGCGRCETQCPFNVPIMQRMKQAAELFGK